MHSEFIGNRECFCFCNTEGEFDNINVSCLLTRINQWLVWVGGKIQGGTVDSRELNSIVKNKNLTCVIVYILQICMEVWPRCGAERCVKLFYYPHVD